MRESTVLVLLGGLVCCQALSCPCWREKSPCDVPTDCKGGLTYDPCGCCQKCARVLNETCGGPWNYVGNCDTGLLCNKDPQDFNAAGICVPAPATTARPEQQPSETTAS